MKSISITRLKQLHASALLRITGVNLWPWNEKHLDYEIETRIPITRFIAGDFFLLEMKSISITRLKQMDLLTLRLQRLSCFSWNEKHLDYEIETEPLKMSRIPQAVSTLEMKSISITRLKSK